VAISARAVRSLEATVELNQEYFSFLPVGFIIQVFVPDGVTGHDIPNERSLNVILEPKMASR